MCTQCLVNPWYYGEVAPGWMLIRTRREESGDQGMQIGDWGLVECNDPSIVFRTTPFVYADKAKLRQAMGAFEDELFTDIDTGYRFYSALQKVKFSISSKRLMVKHHCFNFNSKLYMYLADYIAKSTPVLEKDPFPHIDETVKHDYLFNPRLPYNNELTK